MYLTKSNNEKIINSVHQRRIMSSILNPIERLGTAEVDEEEEEVLEIGADCVGGCCGCCEAIFVTDVDAI